MRKGTRTFEYRAETIAIYVLVRCRLPIRAGPQGAGSCVGGLAHAGGVCTIRLAVNSTIHDEINY